MNYSIIFVTLVITVVSILTIIYKVQNTKKYLNIRQFERKNIITLPKAILLWNSFFESDKWYLPQETVNYEYFKSIKCPVVNCIVTNDKKFLPSVDNFDAVLFHTAREYSNGIPSIRSQHQFYVFSNLESPLNTYHSLEHEKNFYNLTMTYRLDSDIIWSYGFFKDIKTEARISPNLNPKWILPNFKFMNKTLLMNYVKNKTKTVAWFVSNCNTDSNREELKDALAEYINVDVYGECGSKSCSKGSDFCYNMLENTYKFYLSFENSLCKDYVTEKLFKVYEKMVIPIVYGGADYYKFAPPHSYIDANKFKTAKDLANYLIYLNQNPEEYIKYFWWKKYYQVQYPIDTPFCRLCMLLNKPKNNTTVKTYGNIAKWWHENACTTSKIKFE